MAQGGRRAGAGRPLGSKNKNKKARLLSDNVAVASDYAVASDAMLDIMQKIAHDPNIDAQLRLDAAKSAAPYLRARIGSRSPPADAAIKPVEVIVVEPIASGSYVVSAEDAHLLWELKNGTPTPVVNEEPPSVDSDPPPVPSPPSG